MSDDLKGAIDTLCAALRSDPGYRYSWQANIAMSIYDALRRRGIEHNLAHEACNAGADEFLTVLCMERVEVKGSFNLIEDPTVPPEIVCMVDDSGREVGRIENIGIGIAYDED